MTVDDAAQWREQGLAALAAGDRAGALRALTAAVQRNAQDAAAWYALGTLQHDPQRALAAFARTLALDPHHAAAQAAAAQVRRYLSQSATPVPVAAPVVAAVTMPAAPVAAPVAGTAVALVPAASPFAPGMASVPAAPLESSISRPAPSPFALPSDPLAAVAVDDLHVLAQQGIAAAQAGRRVEARTALLRVVEADERDEAAWYWLSTVVDDPQDEQVALENTLHLNPQHPAAALRLQQLRAAVNGSLAPIAEPPTVVVAPAPVTIFRPANAPAPDAVDAPPAAHRAPPPVETPAGPPPVATDGAEYRSLVGRIMAKRYRVVAPFPSGGTLVLLASDIKNGSYLLIRPDTEPVGKNAGPVAKRGFIYDGQPFVVSSIGLNGLSLRTFLDAVGRLPPAQAVQYGLQMIALARRSRGLLLERRSWRPESITITADGALDLTAVPDPEDTQPAPSRLSPPEHHAGQPLDARSDVYLIGALIFFLLTSEGPPTGVPVPQPATLPRKRGPAPPLLAEFPTAPTIPPLVAGVLAQALQADPAARYPTLAALEAALYELADALRQEEKSNRLPRNWLPRLINATLWVGAFVSAMLVMGFILTNRDDPLKALRLRFMPPALTAQPSGGAAASITPPPAAQSPLHQMAIFAPGGRNSLDHLRVQQIDSSHPPTITLYFSAISNDNKPVGDLLTDDFKVFSDTVPISDFQVVNLSTLTETISIYLVMDTSASMVGAPLAGAQRAAIQFVHLFGATDQLGLIQFNDHNTLVQEATADKPALGAKIAGLEAFGNTALYDGVYQAVDLAGKVGGRSLVVVLSDGKDTASTRWTRQAVIAHAQELRVPIHIIGLSGGDDYDSPTLETLAHATGGELLESPDPEQLATLYQLLAFQVAGGYRLTSTAFGTPGTHTIKITITVGDTVYSTSATYTVK